MEHGQYYLAVGSYARKEEPGISLYAYEPETAALTYLRSFAGIENPSFLVIDAQKNRWYVVSETVTFAGEKGGSVAALALQPESGQLTVLNQLPTHGAAPCYLVLDPTNSWLLLANYTGGSICLYSLQENGKIARLTETIQHVGHGVRADRQEGAHPHSIPLDPTGNYAFVPDLGLDSIFIYRLDREAGTLRLHRQVKVEAEAGPRHFVFHPSQRYAYVINELNSTITMFRYDSEEVNLEIAQSIATLPAGFSGVNTCADIHISADGRFLYGSNRGHNSIVAYTVRTEDGTLSLLEHVSTQGETPRNFALAPDGRFLLAANQDSNSVVTYSIDQETGRLTPLAARTLEIAHPACLKFGRIPPAPHTPPFP
jgi:6-phosphogluconolactonase